MMMMTKATSTAEVKVAGALRISAKKLGALAMPNFCPRCFWIRTHLGGEVPFAIFPKIFNELDGYVKRVVDGWLADKDEPPPWLSSIGTIVGSIPPPKASKFMMQIGEMITLTGEADAILTLADGTLAIIDYKTAHHRGVDDPLYPTYLIQLNAYALLAEHLGFGKVSQLALVYTEPMTSDLSARQEDNRRTDGFAMGFRVEILPIPLNTKTVLEYAVAAQIIHSQTAAPKGRSGCFDCERLEALIATSKQVTFDFTKIL
jgi:hypothetical protein